MEGGNKSINISINFKKKSSDLFYKKKIPSEIIYIQFHF